MWPLWLLPGFFPQALCVPTHSQQVVSLGRGAYHFVEVQSMYCTDPANRVVHCIETELFLKFIFAFTQKEPRRKSNENFSVPHIHSIDKWIYTKLKKRQTKYVYLFVKEEEWILGKKNQ